MISNKEYLHDFLHQYQIKPHELYFEHEIVDEYEKRWCPYFDNDRNGNLKINYPSLTGIGRETHNDKGKERYTYRIRWKSPFKNKDGKIQKYKMAEGAETVAFFPPHMLEAYKSKKEIPMLIIVEGEKKAFYMAKNGFDVIGISGIWNFMRKPPKDEDENTLKQSELLPSIKNFIKVCKVRKVVKLDDSDALDISRNETEAATDRPFGFYGAVKRMAELIFQCGCEFYYSYINPHLSEDKLGGDDLLLLHREHEYEVLTDFITGIEERRFTTYFQTVKINFLRDSDIKGIFYLNDPQEFYNYHKKILKDRKTFIFSGRTYEINAPEGTVTERKKNDRGPVWIREGRYEAYNQNNSIRVISNFTMQVLFLLKSSNNPKRIIEFKNVLGQTFQKELNMDDLVSVTAFRKKLIGDGSFIYKGDMFEFLNLQEGLFANEKTATEINSLGWQKHYGFYAFSNGITAMDNKFYPVDDYGIVHKEKEAFYLPAFSSLYNDSDERYENERKFKHISSDTKFSEWTSTFTGVYKDNGHIGICFYIAALFRDIIFSQFNEFPILNLFGQKGSGKSTMASSIMNMFGASQNPIGLESASSTKVAIFRILSQYRNAIVWLDEYKNTIDPKMVGTIKDLYGGIGRQTGQFSNDNRTQNTSVLSSAIVSGQDMPTIDPALFTRVILLMFKNNAFDEQDVKEYNNLKQMEKKGLTAITIELLSHRDLIVEKFYDKYVTLFSKLSEKFKLVDIPDRLIKNAAMIMAPLAILIEENKVTYNITENELFNKFHKVVDTHCKLLADNQEINVFWEILETLFNEGTISFDKGDFRFTKEGQLAIRFNRVYHAYAEKYRKIRGMNGLDKLTLENYLKNSSSFIDVIKVRFATGVSTGYLFKYKELDINLQKTNMDTASEKDLKDADKVELSEEPKEEELPF